MDPGGCAAELGSADTQSAYSLQPTRKRHRHAFWVANDSHPRRRRESGDGRDFLGITQPGADFLGTEQFPIRRPHVPQPHRDLVEPRQLERLDS